MFYHVFSKRTIIDRKGNDKVVTEQFLVKDMTYFGQAEEKVLDLYNAENDVCAMKRSSIASILNHRADERQHIYTAIFEEIFEDAKGVEKTTRTTYGLFAFNMDDAAKIAKEILAPSSNERSSIVEVKKTHILDII